MKIYCLVLDPPWLYTNSMRRYVPPELREFNGILWGQGLGVEGRVSRNSAEFTIHIERVKVVS